VRLVLDGSEAGVGASECECESGYEWNWNCECQSESESKCKRGSYGVKRVDASEIHRTEYEVRIQREYLDYLYIYPPPIDTGQEQVRYPMTPWI
jgi:hypothetical protein